MNARSRAVIGLIQLIVVVVGSSLATGEFLPFDAPFVLLLGIAVNPLLVEWPSPPMGGVVIAALTGLGVIRVTTWSHTPVVVWSALAVALIGLAILAWLAQVLGANRQLDQSVSARIGRVAAALSVRSDSRLILSPVFLLVLVETYREWETSLIRLLATWVTLIVIGAIDWADVFKTLTSSSTRARAEAMVAPSRLVISSRSVPREGQWVRLGSRGVQCGGVVISRIPRPDGFWAEVHVLHGDLAERLLAAGFIDIEFGEPAGRPIGDFVGSVDSGSTNDLLRFVATGPLAVLGIVRVRDGSVNADVIYQVQAAEIREERTSGGSQLLTAVTARQVGIYDKATFKLRRHRWVPQPGAAVFAGAGEVQPDVTQKPSHFFHLGDVAGSEIPVFIDLNEMSSGHTAILGMTKMGKSTLARRLITALDGTRHVVVLDPMSTYKAYPVYSAVADWAQPVSVREPLVINGVAEVPATVAKDLLQSATTVARAEYLKNTPVSWSLLVDEAHQFAPEPVGLDNNSESKRSSIAFGELVLQVRKYGISIILICQRTAAVAKTPLSQCENLIAFRTVDETGLKYVESVSGSNSAEILPVLRIGEVLAFGPAITSENAVVLTLPNA